MKLQKKMRLERLHSQKAAYLGHQPGEAKTE